MKFSVKRNTIWLTSWDDVTTDKISFFAAPQSYGMICYHPPPQQQKMLEGIVFFIIRPKRKEEQAGMKEKEKEQH